MTCLADLDISTRLLDILLHAQVSTPVLHTSYTRLTPPDTTRTSYHVTHINQIMSGHPSHAATTSFMLNVIQNISLLCVCDICLKANYKPTVE